MSTKQTSFRTRNPLTWCFHCNTSRWVHNATTSQGIPPNAGVPRPALEFPDAPYLPLPEPRLPESPLDGLLRQRISCRNFSSTAIELQALSDLLFTGYGVLGVGEFGALEFLERPVPSGGGLYPLELFVLANAVNGLDPGIYHYRAVGHYLEQLRQVQLPLALREYLIMGQTSLAKAPALVVLACELGRTLDKYGDRGYRYLLLEAGHVMQNINLAALSVNLGSCNIGGFFDRELGDLLCLNADTAVPLYAMALGQPEHADRSESRAG